MEITQIVNQFFSVPGLMLLIITTLLGRLVWLSNEQRKEQKEQNKLNADEHKAIFERLTKGIGWFDSMGKDIKRNATTIEKVGKKVENHEIEIVKIKDKIEYKKIGL